MTEADPYLYIRVDRTKDLATMRREFDRAVIANALARNDGKVMRAAAALGITREGLYRIMRRLEMTG